MACAGLMQAGVVGDLYAGRNEQEYRWMVHGRWVFSRSLMLTPDYLQKYARVQLVCDGLDTLGTNEIVVHSPGCVKKKADVSFLSSQPR